MDKISTRPFSILKTGQFVGHFIFGRFHLELILTGMVH